MSDPDTNDEPANPAWLEFLECWDEWAEVT